MYSMLVNFTAKTNSYSWIWPRDCGIEHGVLGGEKIKNNEK